VKISSLCVQGGPFLHHGPFPRSLRYSPSSYTLIRYSATCVKPTPQNTESRSRFSIAEMQYRQKPNRFVVGTNLPHVVAVEFFAKNNNRGRELLSKTTFWWEWAASEQIPKCLHDQTENNCEKYIFISRDWISTQAQYMVQSENPRWLVPCNWQWSFALRSCRIFRCGYSLVFGNYRSIRM
jgi:hypothetical protein